MLGENSVYLGDGWWDLKGDYDALAALADARSGQKQDYVSTRLWCKHNTHLIGLAGELVFALESGMDVDTRLLAEGDGGCDFLCGGLTLDVKTSTNPYGPLLIENDPPKIWKDFYALVVFDAAQMKGKMFGWCSQQDIRSGESRDFGHGPRLVMSPDSLRKGLPSCCISESQHLEVLQEVQRGDPASV